MNTPLTAAFIAIGVKDALHNVHGKTYQDLLDRYEGFLGVVDHVIGFAPTLDARFDELQAAGEDFGGVFVYEVAEPFGREYTKALVANFAADPMRVIDALMPLPKTCPETYVVVVGDVINGVSVHGPFDSYETAEAWASSERDSDWHIVEVQKPDAA